MIFSKDFDLFSAIQKVRLSEKTSEILGQVSEKMKLESLAGLPECDGQTDGWADFPQHIQRLQSYLCGVL